jgi:hypothetical protein
LLLLRRGVERVVHRLLLHHRHLSR